ncbi:hypothetical protein CLOM_g12251 [Closterium sp. NIES-68]|nr:hypothetical protein CLOM_g12251 [Closterium sp. NIES-68]GJP86618.1 hypothetical protein CLOP_g16619 [Closterium sp. NIES-67]
MLAVAAPAAVKAPESTTPQYQQQHRGWQQHMAFCEAPDNSNGRSSKTYGSASAIQRHQQQQQLCQQEWLQQRQKDCSRFVMVASSIARHQQKKLRGVAVTAAAAGLGGVSVGSEWGIHWG